MKIKLLKKVFFANAIFSISSGLFMAIFSMSLAKLMGVENNLILKYLGIALIVFGFSLIYHAAKSTLKKKEVWLVIIQDLIWVICSIVLLLIRPFGLTIMGNQMIGGVAVMVLLFACLQYYGLKK